MTIRETPPVPSREEILADLGDTNWGRWGPTDQAGTVNLITPEKRLSALRLVRSGRLLSIARDFPCQPAPNNPHPAQFFMRVHGELHGDGAATDYYGIQYHGRLSTHIDALSHIWNGGRLWNGASAAEHIGFNGVTFGGIENWSAGIVTRGVLLDVPRFRGEPCVTQEKPVHGWELEEIAKAEGVALEPGDAIAVYCGRASLEALEASLGTPHDPRLTPGLHMSCLRFLKDADCAVLVWDMMDLRPNGYDLPWGVHSSIFTLGLALVDNAILEPLAEACAEEGRYEFLLMLAPLRVVGGTGSPVNPLVML